MWWEPICAVAYPVSALALGLLLKSGYNAVTVKGLLCGLLIFAFPILWVKFWRWRHSRLWWDYCDHLLTMGDLANIESFYAERADGGVSAFLVAVAAEGEEERIAGCAGLGELNSPFSHLEIVHSGPARA